MDDKYRDVFLTHREADAVRDEDDGADGLGAAGPGEDTLTRRVRVETARPWPSDRIESGGRCEGLKQRHGVACFASIRGLLSMCRTNKCAYR